MEDDLKLFLYLRFRFSSPVFSNLSLFLVFSHFCFCKRTCDHKKSSGCYCQFYSRIYSQIFDNLMAFQDIIIDERYFTLEFNNFFSKDFTFFSRRLPWVFLSILIRLCLSYFFSLLNEVCLKETQKIFFRRKTWKFASDIMYDFYLHVNIDYFNNLFS